MAIYANLSIDQGTSYSTFITVSDAAGQIVDLTSYTTSGQIRKTYSSSTFTAFTASITNATGGEIKISLTAAQTAALKPGRYVYDVIVTSPTGDVSRVVEGQVDINAYVTR
jgi:hypothetical protein